MHITFKSIKIRDLCECSSRAVEYLGADGAVLLQRTIADLKAAQSTKDMPPLYELCFQNNSNVEIKSEARFSVLAKIRKVDSTDSQAIKIIRLRKYE